MTYIARVSLLVVRHAHAGQRSGWSGDDRLRPLSEKGTKQALALADSLSVHRPGRILSSPAVRCMATMEPLADQLGVVVEADERLAEGAGTSEVVAVLREIGQDPAALCSHGDVVPQILRHLVDEGMTPAQGMRWAKASTWLVGRTEHGWGTGTYLSAPSL